MRIMIVLEATAGGTLRHVVELAPRLQARGYSVHLVCSTRRRPACSLVLEDLREAGITVSEMDMRRDVDPLRDCAAAFRLARLIRRTKPDILHLHSSKAGALGRAAMALLPGRSPAVVYTPHCYAFLSQPGNRNRTMYRWIERALLLWTNRVAAVSESEAAAARGLGACHKVRIIANGVALPCTPAASADPRVFRIGWLGRLVWQKNPEAAVTVSFVLNQLGIEHELIMGGDGPGRSSVEAAIRDLGCGHSVRLAGHVSDTTAFHGSLGAFLMTSRAEGLPYSGLDAMAHGVPIVGFDVPGVRDLVNHGADGLLSPTDDPGALAAHLARLAQDPELRCRFGAVARARVRAEFLVERQAERLCSLYRSLVPEPRTNAVAVPA